MAMTLNFRFRDRWRALRRGRPGQRFQQQYELAQCEADACGPGERLVLMLVAVTALAIAVVLSVVPGPAIPFFVLAGALLAAESRTMARFMDWLEVLFRRGLAWSNRRWRRLTTVGRSVLLVLFGGVVAASVYLAYRVLAK